MQNKTRCKVFKTYPKDLEDAVNKWLAKNEEVSILKTDMVLNGDTSTSEVVYTILYRI